MHGNLEPEEDWFRPTPNEHVNDLWEDMDRLNALYEELCWGHDDELVFTHDSERIIVYNKTQEEK